MFKEFLKKKKRKRKYEHVRYPKKTRQMWIGEKIQLSEIINIIKETNMYCSGQTASETQQKKRITYLEERTE